MTHGLWGYKEFDRHYYIVREQRLKGKCTQKEIHHWVRCSQDVGGNVVFGKDLFHIIERER